MSISNKISVGIDLGTTFSSIAVYNTKEDQPTVLKNKSNQTSFPSWVSFENLQTMVGYDAKNSIQVDCVVHDVKRIIGRTKKEISKQDKKFWGFDLYFDNDNDLNAIPKIQCLTACDDHKLHLFEPEEISGIILRYLKNLFHFRNEKAEIGNIVVTVPADFNSNQKKATLTACKLAGLENVILLNEPTAATLDYKRRFPDDVKNVSNVIVIDFGGGTLDINRCNIVGERVNVISNYSNQNLGGNDFDYKMMKLIKKKLIEDCVIDKDFYDLPKNATPTKRKIVRKRINRLRKEAERIKIELSSHINVEFNKNLLFDENDEFDEECLLSCEVTQQEFENECLELIKKLEEGMSEVCTQDDIDKNKIGLVILTGGTCQIPMVRKAISDKFGEKNISKKFFDSMNAVVNGAAYYAHTKGSYFPGNLEISDKITRSIGIKVNGNEFSKIYEKGNDLGQKFSKEVWTSTQKQKDVQFEIYCGENEYIDSDDMIFLGTFKIFDIPQYEGINTHFNVEMEVDECGLLTVTAYSLPPDNEEEENQNENECNGQLQLEMDLRPIDEKFEEVKKDFMNYLPPMN